MKTPVKSDFVDRWSELWAAPSARMCREMVTDDVVACWSGMPEPIRGGDAYADHVGAIAKLVPTLRLEATAHAEAGEFLFISWRASATIGGRPFEHHGIDRFRLRDGRACESLVAYDPGPFTEALAAAAERAPADGRDEPPTREAHESSTSVRADTAELIRRYGEAWNAHDLDAIMSFHHEGATFCLHLGEQRAIGKSGVREAFAASLTQWPDLRFTSERLLIADGFLAHEMTFAATAEGREVSVPIVDVITLKDGQILTKDTYVDSQSLTNQLGERASRTAAEALVANFRRLWSSKDPELVTTIVAPDAVAHWSGVGTFRGEDYPERMRNTMREVVPDMRLEVTASATEGDYVFISWHASATIGGRKVEWDGIDRFRLRGQLADEVYAIWDSAPLRDALGQTTG